MMLMAFMPEIHKKKGEVVENIDRGDLIIELNAVK